jgi:enoyl-[acyl-carrier-protein] reductase (NADH)
VIHPDAVFDTALWTPEALAQSAARYGMTVEEYKSKNLLGREIRSIDVARLLSTVASDVFGATTGAQIPIDGGNDRVI